MELVVERPQVFFVLTSAETVANICQHPEGNQLPDVFDAVLVNGCRQLFAVVIVVILLLPSFVGDSESERNDRIDEEIPVKSVRSAVDVNHFVDKHGGGFVRRFACVGDLTLLVQALGVCEGNPCHAGTKATRIDSQNQMSGMVIVVEFTVECT